MALRGFLTLTANGEAIRATPGGSAAVGRRDQMEFTEFRMGMSSGREGSSGEATARRTVGPVWCRLTVSGAFPRLMQAQIQNAVCEGRFQFVDERGRDTWSIEFQNGRINRLELVTSRASRPEPDYIELEIVADQWNFNHPSGDTSSSSDSAGAR